jgi:hypothetical protein
MAALRHRHAGVTVTDVTSYIVNWKDIFHLDNLYLLMHEWLVEHNYASRDVKSFPERYYLHKEGQAGKEIWFRWRPNRMPLAGNNRWRFDIDIDVHVLTMKDVEAVIAGKKYKAHQGEVEVQVSAKLIEDPSGEVKKGLFKEVREFMYKRVWREQAEKLKKELYAEAMQFRDAVNTFLKIETYLPAKEWPEFWPKRVPE